MLIFHIVRVDETQIEAPETPAPVFAVRAFKHAIFGTPQPPPTVAPVRLSKTKKESDDPFSVPTLTSSKENENNTELGLSPTKRGILKTPGGGTTRRKELVWGADVVDNEGKKQSRSGLPNNAPGKFPSPWTPKTVDVTEDKKSNTDEKKPKTKLAEKLYDAKPTGTSPRSVKGRAKDDTDITIDMLEPRSESGRYWKEQYMAYSQKSEEETKKLIAKQKLAREYARKKDEEATELRRQIESDRKKRHTRESSLEVQVKDLREQLRQALAENARTCTEIAMLRRQAEAASISQPAQNMPTIEPPTASTKSASPIRISRTQRPQSPDLAASLWNDAAEDSRLNLGPFLSSSIIPDRLQSEPAGNRQRRVQRRPAIISRQDSVVVAEDATQKSETRKSGTLTRTLTPRPGSLTPTLTRRTLGERDMNSFLSPPTLSLPSPTDLENMNPSPARKHRRNRDAEKRKPDPFLFDASAPLEALSMQAEQPTTPQPHIKETKHQDKIDQTPIPSSRKHRRTEAKADLPEDRLAAARAKVAMEVKVDLPADRLAAAKARLAARKMKENTRTA
jgi:Cut12 conserved domain